MMTQGFVGWAYCGFSGCGCRGGVLVVVDAVVVFLWLWMPWWCFCGCGCRGGVLVVVDAVVVFLWCLFKGGLLLCFLLSFVVVVLLVCVGDFACVPLYTLF